MAKKIRLSLKVLTRRELRILRRQQQKWHKRIQPMLDAIDTSTKITADDLKSIVR